MNARIFNAIAGRLSLRPPQRESLQRLAQALDAAPAMLEHEPDLEAVLAALKAEFPTLEAFERDFPSLCFALATGVGKTRLMGAFIGYLHLAHGFKHFFVLAPNLTIYNKLIADFTPNTPKYVFTGIAEFAAYPPEIITGDNYEQRAGNLSLLSPVTVNIFNISKINSEVRGGKSPRIKRLSEYLGDSYFNYLAELEDLVLLMDESHRYRASAGVRAINELKPLFGLELTATPFTESSRGPLPFKNVVMDYPLAQAIEDGFVKEPAVVTQRDFDAKRHTPEEIEKIKLEDGIRVHEATKVELLTHARRLGKGPVKPFVLVIARDTTHAAQLRALIESEAFFEGRYRDKVIQVDSSKSGKEEEQMVQRLLAVESAVEPTELVIHVNMLKEGWDVTNLYSIVPLRAANARTLIEQSIGRGLRLPFGRRTGVPAVDRLNIVAHDRFQEIIDEANRGDSPIRLKQVVLDAPSATEPTISVQVVSNTELALGLTVPKVTGGDGQPYSMETEALKTPVFNTDRERQAASAVMDVIDEMERDNDRLPNSTALTTAQVQQAIVERVRQRLAPAQGELLPDEGLDLEAVVAQTAETVVRGMIDIPRISMVPTGEVTVGFNPFTLDLSGLRLQPADRELVIQMLQSNRRYTLASDGGITERRLEDYVVSGLIDYDDIDYEAHAELLYDLAGQMVQHLLGYLSEDEARAVLDRDRRLIAEAIRAQMMEHFWEKATGYEVRVSRGFTKLRPCDYTATGKHPVRHYRETLTDKSSIKKILFNGFSKCLYPLQKFDSDSERRFAVILERDAQKWFRPAKGQFQIYYKLGAEQPEYVPDFVAESRGVIYQVETKAREALKDPEVLAKADAASRWCQRASDYAQTHGGKPWRYLLIPHDEINEARALAGFERFAVCANA
ncbi:MAG: DEAD/DEAH box helicase family protein [Thiohalocapsa sp. PB-PSB1]|jgi:type III restriction enzyme|nr:MAG: DEAD/DEAH box helicase family protein [Thiohalocapsa sp. PB-PSB1]